MVWAWAHGLARLDVGNVKERSQEEASKERIAGWTQHKRFGGKQRSFAFSNQPEPTFFTGS